jgi:hypothetical protein
MRKEANLANNIKTGSKISKVVQIKRHGWEIKF